MIPRNSSVGQRIVYYRKQKGLTRKELALMARIQTDYLGDIETGKIGTRISTLARIAWALGVSLSELLEDGEEKGP